MGIFRSKLSWLLFVTALAVGAILAWWQITNENKPVSSPTGSDFTMVVLPAPEFEGSMSLERAIKNRRSVHSFGSLAMELKQISRLTWAAQGITDNEEMLRAAPSPDRSYQLSLYVAAQNVNDLEAGIYKYDPYSHQLQGMIAGNKSFALLLQVKQPVVEQAAAVFIIAGPSIDQEEKNWELRQNYLYLESGHVAQNLLLQATAMNLGSLPLGSFSRPGMKKFLQLEDDQEVLYIVAAGNKP